jgi:chromosome segregation ATPase
MNISAFDAYLILSRLTGVGGEMNISVDFWQLVTMLGAGFSVLCGVLIWSVRTVSTATATWGEVTGAIQGAQREIRKLSETIQKIEDDRDIHKSEIQSLKTEISFMQTQFMQRIEILETLKRSEQFFANILLLLQRELKSDIKMDVPDLQTPIIQRQQRMDDVHSRARQA